jgi:hypothetical protein
MNCIGGIFGYKGEPSDSMTSESLLIILAFQLIEVGLVLYVISKSVQGRVRG